MITKKETKLERLKQKHSQYQENPFFYRQENMLYARGWKNYSQMEIALELGCVQGTYHGWEVGFHPIPLDAAIQFAEIVECDFDEIFRVNGKDFHRVLDMEERLLECV